MLKLWVQKTISSSETTITTLNVHAFKPETKRHNTLQAHITKRLTEHLSAMLKMEMKNVHVMEFK